MWRGPAWINMNLLVYHGLKSYGFIEEAALLAHRSMEEITRWYTCTGCLYEYYDSLGETPPVQLPRKGAPGAAGGTGFGVVADLNWTAAAYIHFLHEVV
jgi:neutral trehalase